MKVPISTLTLKGADGRAFLFSDGGIRSLGEASCKFFPLSARQNAVVSAALFLFYFLGEMIWRNLEVRFSYTSGYI